MNIYFLPYWTVSIENALGTARNDFFARDQPIRKFQFKWGSPLDGFASGVSNWWLQEKGGKKSFTIFFLLQRNKFHWIYFIIKLGNFFRRDLCNKRLEHNHLKIWYPLKLVNSFESNRIKHVIWMLCLCLCCFVFVSWAVHILRGLSFNFIRFSDKSPEIHIVWSKRF